MNRLISIGRRKIPNKIQFIGGINLQLVRQFIRTTDCYRNVINVSFTDNELVSIYDWSPEYKKIDAFLKLQDKFFK